GKQLLVRSHVPRLSRGVGEGHFRCILPICRREGQLVLARSGPGEVEHFLGLEVHDLLDRRDRGLVFDRLRELFFVGDNGRVAEFRRHRAFDFDVERANCGHLLFRHDRHTREQHRETGDQELAHGAALAERRRDGGFNRGYLLSKSLPRPIFTSLVSPALTMARLAFSNRSRSSDGLIPLTMPWAASPSTPASSPPTPAVCSTTKSS